MATRWKAGELIMKPKLTELTSKRDAFLLAKGLAE